MASTILDGLKKAVKTPKLILGARRSLAAMKADKLDSIYVAVNAPAHMQEDIDHFAKFVQAQVIKLDIASDELGMVCKRQHTVTVAAVLK